MENVRKFLTGMAIGLGITMAAIIVIAVAAVIVAMAFMGVFGFITGECTFLEAFKMCLPILITGGLLTGGIFLIPAKEEDEEGEESLIETK